MLFKHKFLQLDLHHLTNLFHMFERSALRGLISLSLLAFLVPASAQTAFKCGSDLMRQRAIANDLRILDNEAALEAWTQNYIAQTEGQREGDTIIYTIPMVFHVLHNYGNENISDEQIFDAVRILNVDYSKQNADTANILGGFDTVAANVQIRFKLATKDPNGNCTNGIDRIRTNEAFVGDDGSKLNPWFEGRYLNVWTCAQMENGVAGYAYYPGSAPNFADGVIILHDYVGSIGTSAPGRSRALTHEIGHYLNLQHPWGNTNDPGVECGDDGVSDTPITKGWTYCPSLAASAACDSTIFENFQNYMDYSYCSVMFTNGQRARMRAAMAGAPAGRTLLWDASNLAFTGTDGTTDQLCTPLPGAYASERFVCTGSPVTFLDNSTRGVPTAWSWDMPGANPSSSTQQNPTVTYSTPGWKTVTLTTSNDQGATTAILEQLVLVSDGVDIQGALSESFPNAASSSNWPSDNVDSDNCFWQWSNLAGHNDMGCMRLNAYDSYFPLDWNDNGDNAIDELASPSMDLDFLNAQGISFWYAYASRSTDVDLLTETLKIYSSTDCGRNWTIRSTLQFPELITGGVQGAGYVPAASEWTQHMVNLPSSITTNDVRFKFVYTSSGASNDLFIDDVNVTGSVGMAESGSTATVAMQPNPTDGQVTINLNLPSAGPGLVQIVDAQGRLVWNQQIRVAGTQRFNLNMRDLGLSAGIYMVRLMHTSGTATTRLVFK